jgi:hypothetical protein
MMDSGSSSVAGQRSLGLDAGAAGLLWNDFETSWLERQLSA